MYIYKNTYVFIMIYPSIYLSIYLPIFLDHLSVCITVIISAVAVWPFRVYFFVLFFLIDKRWLLKPFSYETCCQSVNLVCSFMLFQMQCLSLCFFP